MLPGTLDLEIIKYVIASFMFYMHHTEVCRMCWFEKNTSCDWLLVWIMLIIQSGKIFRCDYWVSETTGNRYRNVHIFPKIMHSRYMLNLKKLLYLKRNWSHLLKWTLITEFNEHFCCSKYCGQISSFTINGWQSPFKTVRYIYIATFLTLTML